MTMRLLFFILIAILNINNLKADCTACWELRKVEITLNNGDNIVGFVKWNDAWWNGDNIKKWAGKFPESFVPYYQSLNYNFEILVIKELIPVANDSLNLLIGTKNKLIATKQENLTKLDYKQIKSVIEIDKNSEHFQGAGSISVYTQEELDKLNTNPYATHYVDGVTADVYFLSYNPEITREQMKELGLYTYGNLCEAYSKKGVIMVMISFD